MKHFILFFSVLCLNSAIHAQTVCDSLSVDTVIIENNTFQITVYNSSQTFIAYPFFTVDLDENPYIDFIDSLSVPTFLGIPSDASNGYTSGYYSSVTIANAAAVPSNTLFSGHLIIQDPNDSTFYCSLPFSFTYGSQVANLATFDSNFIQLYPNPSTGIFNISSSEEAIVSIIDANGRVVLQDLKVDKTTTFHLEKDGFYTLTLNTSIGISHVKIMVMH
ncbi:MAG: T9SS type A sorting domain-containing protein [Fluviicola sp.]|nr:T9SS type A sorting domain-containing protein [Fluviicola sp.]